MISALRIRLLFAAGLGALLGCNAVADSPVEPNPPASVAKGATGISVTAADPPYGKPGEAGKQVRIFGSGFADGDQASWQRGGVTDPKIPVQSTQYVSSTELVATISIADDATLALYDIAIIRPGRKGGIGTELFEVTTATPLPFIGNQGSSAYAWGINDAGQIVGRSGTYAFFWDPSTGIENLGTGQAMDLAGDGQTAVGTTSVGGGQAVVWLGGSGHWVSSLLVTGCVAGPVAGGTAYSITADGRFAAGALRVEVARNKERGRPVIWDLLLGTCIQLVRPASHSDHAHLTDVNTLGMAVGLASDARGADRAVYWDANGTPTLLPGVSGGAQAIAGDGSIVVGSDAGRPVYWVRNGLVWSSPNELPTGPCTSQTTGWASDINADGVIVGKGCDAKPWMWTVSGGIITSATVLSGLGPKSLGQPSAVGTATTGTPWIAGASADMAVYWVRP